MHFAAGTDKKLLEMPDRVKGSRANSVTPGSMDSRDSRRRDDDADSVEFVEDVDDEGYSGDSCDDVGEVRVRFKVRASLRVNIFAANGIFCSQFGKRDIFDILPTIQKRKEFDIF